MADAEGNDVTAGRTVGLFRCLPPSFLTLYANKLMWGFTVQLAQQLQRLLFKAGLPPAERLFRQFEVNMLQGGTEQLH